MLLIPLVKQCDSSLGSTDTSFNGLTGYFAMQLGLKTVLLKQKSYQTAEV